MSVEITEGEITDIIGLSLGHYSLIGEQSSEKADRQEVLFSEENDEISHVRESQLPRDNLDGKSYKLFCKCFKRSQEMLEGGRKGWRRGKGLVREEGDRQDLRNCCLTWTLGLLRAPGVQRFFHLKIEIMNQIRS